MSAESEAAVLEQLLADAEAERAAEVAERKALGEKIDRLAAQVKALAEAERNEDGGKLDTLIAEVKALRAAMPAPQTIKVRKDGKRKISFTVTGRGDDAMITDADITIQ